MGLNKSGRGCLGLVLEPIRICASYKPKGTSGNWVKSLEWPKKELAKEEHDGYDSRHENLPVGSESRMLRYGAEYNQKRLKTNQRQRIKRHENTNERSRNETSRTES